MKVKLLHILDCRNYVGSTYYSNIKVKIMKKLCSSGKLGKSGIGVADSLKRIIMMYLFLILE